MKQFSVNNWNFVPTGFNPANIDSRLQTVTSLTDSIWFSGPGFLQEQNQPDINFKESCADNHPESVTEEISLRTESSRPADCGISRICSRVSSWTKAIRTCRIATTYAFRILDRLRQMKGQHLAIRETSQKEAELIFIRNRPMQLFQYNESITLLKVKGGIPASPPLSQLSPFISKEDILCVCGRLRHSDLHSRQKFPTILPKDHPLTLLILRECHSKIHHQGRIFTVSAVRDSGYFIQNSSKLIKKYLKKCVTCQRLRGSFMEQIMNDLPADRLAPVPRFENSAVDVFGPYTITDGVTTRRRSATKKCWALLFYLFGFPSSTSGAPVSHGRHCL